MGKGLKAGVTLLLAFVCSTAYSQKVQVSVSSPRAVEVGKLFNVSFISNVRPDDFAAPDFKGVEVVSGPVASNGYSVSIDSRGNMVQDEKYSFTYTFVSREEGRITIPSATFVIEDRNYKTNSTDIEAVVNRSAPAATTQQDASASQPRVNPAAEIRDDDILLRVLVSRSELYKGEALRVRIKLYTTLPLRESEMHFPQFNGFWVHEFSTAGEQWERETYNGRVYDSKIYRDCLIFPQQSGRIQLERSDMEVYASFTEMQSRGVFAIAVRKEVMRKVVAPPVLINVKELPSGAPESFNGAVGRYNITSNISATDLTANSSGTYTITVSGTGNINFMDPVTVDLPSSFEKYNVKVTDDITNSSGGMEGTRKFEYPFIARAEGRYVVPPAKLTYFDPETKKYQTIYTKEFNVSVTRDPASGQASGGARTGVVKEDLQILGSDVRYIYTGDVRFAKGCPVLIWTWKYVALLAILLLLFFVLLALLRRRMSVRRDQKRMRTRGANKMALRRLRQAKRHMDDDRRNEFYEEVLKALWGYMGDRLLIPVCDLSKDRIVEVLAHRQVPQGYVGQFVDVVSECEFARYAPSSHANVAKVYAEAVEVISRVEASLK